MIHLNTEDIDWECNSLSLESSFFKCFGLLDTLEQQETSFLIKPIDGSIRSRFTHPERSSFSRFGTSSKFGNLIRFLEPLRFIVFNLGRYCDAEDQQKWKHYLLLFQYVFIPSGYTNFSLSPCNVFLSQKINHFLFWSSIGILFHSL